MEGFHLDTPIKCLCRREGIHPGTYFAYLKDFIWAGKTRLIQETTRDTNKVEGKDIKRENTSNPQKTQVSKIKKIFVEFSIFLEILAEQGAKRQLGMRNFLNGEYGLMQDKKDVGFNPSAFLSNFYIRLNLKSNYEQDKLEQNTLLYNIVPPD